MREAADLPGSAGPAGGVGGAVAETRGRGSPGEDRAAVGAAPLLSVRHLKTYFPVYEGGLIRRVVGHVKAVDDVSFDVMRGETVGMVGESGCGKTTIGRNIVRLVRPMAGSITFDGVELTGLGRREFRPFYRRIQMIYQDSYAAMDPRMSIGDIIAEPLDIHGVGDRQSRREQVRGLLATVKLAARLADVHPHELSGGQRQRVGIARALALKPDLIVCDEPVSALDVSIQAQIINLLQELQSELGLTYLFIAHDLAVVHHIADRIVVVYLGKVMEIAPSEVLGGSPLHPYTRKLLGAIPVPDPAVEFQWSGGAGPSAVDAPSATEPPRGCRFSGRCPTSSQVMAEHGIDCSRLEPKLSEVESGHSVACHCYAACRPR